MNKKMTYSAVDWLKITEISDWPTNLVPFSLGTNQKEEFFQQAVGTDHISLIREFLLIYLMVCRDWLLRQSPCTFSVGPSSTKTEKSG